MCSPSACTFFIDNRSHCILNLPIQRYCSVLAAKPDQSRIYHSPLTNGATASAESLPPAPPDEAALSIGMGKQAAFLSSKAQAHKASGDVHIHPSYRTSSSCQYGDAMAARKQCNSQWTALCHNFFLALLHPRCLAWDCKRVCCTPQLPHSLNFVAVICMWT